MSSGCHTEIMVAQGDFNANSLARTPMNVAERHHKAFPKGSLKGSFKSTTRVLIRA